MRGMSCRYGIGGVACLDHRGERVAVLLQRAERLGDVGDQRLVERRQGAGERGGEADARPGAWRAAARGS